MINESIDLRPTFYLIFRMNAIWSNNLSTVYKLDLFTLPCLFTSGAVHQVPVPLGTSHQDNFSEISQSL